MAQGKAIPEDVQWIIIRLSAVMPVEDISSFTDVGLRRVKGILSHFRQTGGVKVSSHSKPQLHRNLCDYDIEACSSASLLTALFDWIPLHVAPVYDCEQHA